MFRFLFLLFLIVPLIEIWLLIKVGGLIGAIPTIFLVVFTAVLGALLLRQQGFSTLQRARRAMEQGQLPAVQLLEGVVLLISGALLLTPGFFTDTLGFLGLVPPLRRRLIQGLMRRGFVRTHSHGKHASDRSRIIEGEFRREQDDDHRSS